MHTGVQEIPVLWLGLSSDGGVRSRFHASTIAAGSMVLTDAVGWGAFLLARRQKDLLL